MDPTHSSCPHTRSTRALLWVLGPATLAVAPIQVLSTLTAHPWLLATALSVVLLGAAWWRRPQDLWPRLAASTAFCGWSVATLLEHLDNPARGLAVLLGLVLFFTYLWPVERLRRWAVTHQHLHPDEELLAASAVASLFGLDEWQLNPNTATAEHLALALTYSVLVALAARRSSLNKGWHRLLLGLAALTATLPALQVIFVGLQLPGRAPPLGLLAPILVFGWVGRRTTLRWLALDPRSDEPEVLEALLAHPSRILVLSFLLICAGGTALVALPFSSTSAPIPWLDAAFTSVSATCVTGLAVVDTAADLSGFGQASVLALIQLGGLGIMVFSAAAIVLLGKRMSLSHERVAVDLVGASSRADLVHSLKAVLVVTFASEGLAALLLFFAFVSHGDPLGTALWRAGFTAISAFCNAGFALQSDSLVPYAHSPFVLAVIGLTIMVSGLGPPVVASMVAWRDPTRRTLHARLVLWTSVLLWVIPAALIAALEWHNTLRGLGVVDKLANATFQSVTLRTAGFNSIDLTALHPATWTLMILLMFVGGSPGSTAGGVKTTTIAVVVLSVLAVVKGQQRVEVFGRTLPAHTVMRATAVTTLAVLGACGALVGIQLTQTIPLDVALFEVISALATVGLSTGATGALDEVGKIIIMLCMFIGRVGPLTMFIFLASTTRPPMSRRFPEEPVPIG